MKRGVLLFVCPILFWAVVGARAMTSAEAGGAILPLMPKGASGRLGVMVKSLKTGKVIFAYNEGKSFVPASNAKVFVSAASLWLLKPDYRFKTEFSTDGALRDGVLYGDLYVKGYGDPTLTSSHLEYIAHEFKVLGITHISGSIVVDDSYFDEERYGPGWKESWKGVSYSPPVSALTLNLNTVTIRISPERVGEKPTVEFEPPRSGFRVVNEAVTAYNSKGGVRAEFLPDGETVVVSGSISPRAGALVVTRAVPEPALYAGRSFKAALGGVGIRVEGGVRRGVVPPAARRLYTHFSDALSDIVAEYNKNSVNVIGENIIKTLGAAFLSPPGSRQKGASVIEDFTN
ncbi:MAG: D-alanyl-D-alanine carboxypeptidase/D-alanyl-D-alanine-endopeptidase, partial [Candidatus Methanosuratincola sp.]